MNLASSYFIGDATLAMMQTLPVGDGPFGITKSRSSITFTAARPMPARKAYLSDHWTQVKVARQKSRPWRANLRAHFAPPPARSAPRQTRTSRSTVLGQRTVAGARPRHAQECRKSGSGAALTGPTPSLTCVRWPEPEFAQVLG